MKHRCPVILFMWLSDQENAEKPPLKAMTGWFPDRRKENHPVCVGFGGFALILDDAATPPCGDARRGIPPSTLDNTVLARRGKRRYPSIPIGLILLRPPNQDFANLTA